MKLRLPPHIAAQQECSVDRPNDVHIKPGYGYEHESSLRCWCKPRLYSIDTETLTAVWIHREQN